jgi:hypothetical protein
MLEPGESWSRFQPEPATAGQSLALSGGRSEIRCRVLWFLVGGGARILVEVVSGRRRQERLRMSESAGEDEISSRFRMKPNDSAKYTRAMMRFGREIEINQGLGRETTVD